MVVLKQRSDCFYLLLEKFLFKLVRFRDWSFSFAWAKNSGAIEN